MSSHFCSVFDVAKYMLEQMGATTMWKLHNLLYYCQAWSLVWDEEPIFDSPIIVKEKGAVVVDLLNAIKGKCVIYPEDIDGNPENLREYHKETADAIIRDYGRFSSRYLTDLVQMEDPWLETFKKEGIGAIITHEAMIDYYGSL